MTLKEVMRTLQKMGTPQNRKVYKRHGITTPLYGVSYKNLKVIQKQIGIDHALSLALWDTENHDARVLACKIGDGTTLNVKTINTWIKHLSNYVLSDAFASLITKTPFLVPKMKQWTTSKQEWPRRVGWLLMTHIAMKDPHKKDAFFEAALQTIETKIHQQKNRVKDAMNSALIAIGIRNATLSKQAIEVARRIGKLSVDHGKTNCQTPLAEAYIKRTLTRQKNRASSKPLKASKRSLTSA